MKSNILPSLPTIMLSCMHVARPATLWSCVWDTHSQSSCLHALAAVSCGLCLPYAAHRCSCQLQRRCSGCCKAGRTANSCSSRIYSHFMSFPGCALAFRRWLAPEQLQLWLPCCEVKPVQLQLMVALAERVIASMIEHSWGVKLRRP